MLEAGTAVVYEQRRIAGEYVVGVEVGDGEVVGGGGGGVAVDGGDGCCGGGCLEAVAGVEVGCLGSSGGWWCRRRGGGRWW